MYKKGDNDLSRLLSAGNVIFSAVREYASFVSIFFNKLQLRFFAVIFSNCQLFCHTLSDQPISYYVEVFLTDLNIFWVLWVYKYCNWGHDSLIWMNFSSEKNN